MKPFSVQEMLKLSESHGDSSIHTRCRACLDSYSSLKSALKAIGTSEAFKIGFQPQSTLNNLEDAHIRFKIWATNIDALHQPNVQSSLDFRLIESPGIRQTALNILVELEVSLKTALLIVTGINPNERWRVGAISDSEEDDVADGEETSELDDLLSAIQTANGSLMKLSVVIRTSPQWDNYLQAASRINLDAEYDINQVKNKYRSIKRRPDWLLERLRKSITRRRQFLKYRKHEAELLQSWEDIATEQAGKRGALTVTNIKLMETKATSAHYESESGSSVESRTSEGSDNIKRAKLEVPSPPKDAFNGISFDFGKPFRCPYCCIEQIVKNKTAWRAHVLRDLKPYVYTFKECDLKMLETRNDWFAHELRNHRREWICPFCPEIFTSREIFRNHLVLIHSLIAANSMEALILRSEEPVDKISASACPLCDDLEKNHPGPNHPASQSPSDNSAPVEPSVTIHRFKRHLGRHMEQLALFALSTTEFQEFNEHHGTRLDLEELQKEHGGNKFPASSSAAGKATVQTAISAPFKTAEIISKPKLATILEPPDPKVDTLQQWLFMKEKTKKGNKIINPIKRWSKPQRSSFDDSSSSAPSSLSGRTWSDTSSTLSTMTSNLSWRGSSSSATTFKVTRSARQAQLVTLTQIRELNEFIRLRYALDNMIWGQRKCGLSDRPRIEELGRRADALLKRIVSIVDEWDNPDVWNTQRGDWQRLREIKYKLELSGKRVWADHPPWEQKTLQPRSHVIYTATQP